MRRALVLVTLMGPLLMCWLARCNFAPWLLILLCNTPSTAASQGCWVIGDVDDYTHEYRMYIDAVRLGEGSSSGAASLLMEGGELREGRGEGEGVSGERGEVRDCG